MASDVLWEGDPILYRRTRGHGLVIRDLHYMFDPTGRLESVTGINAKVLKIILERVYPDKDVDLLMLAKAPGLLRRKTRLENQKKKAKRGAS